MEIKYFTRSTYLLYNVRKSHEFIEVEENSLKKDFSWYRE